MPSTVEIISDFAFYELDCLISISMPGVKRVGNYAFYGSSLQTIVSAPMLESVGEFAFDETRWFNSHCTNGFIILNNLLLRYIDSNESITDVEIPDNVTSIQPKAFSDSKLQSLVIPSGVEFIDSRIFENCSNIKKVIFKGQIPPSVVGLLTDGTGINGDALTIYVPYQHRSIYETNLSYLNSLNGPFAYVYTLYYRDITNRSYCYTQEFTQEELPLAINFPAPNPALNFAGWSFANRHFDEATTISNAGSDIVLYAFYKYNVRFVLENGDEDIVNEIIYHDEFSFPAPTRKGYYLSSWENITTGGSYFASTTTGILDNDFSTTEGWTIKAVWVPNSYELVVNDNGDWWVYISENNNVLLSRDQKFIHYGDSINITELVALFKENGIGFRTGYTLVGFTFGDTVDDSFGGPSNADRPPYDQTEPVSQYLWIPYLGENGSTVYIINAEEETQTFADNVTLYNSTTYHLYSIYELEQYDIRFYLNGHLIENISRTYTYGEYLINLGYIYQSYGDFLRNFGDIEESYSDFIKWSTLPYPVFEPDSDLPSDTPQNRFLFSTMQLYDFTPNVDGNITSPPLELYAILQKRCKVDFKNYDDTILKTDYVIYGGNATPPENPSRLGYSFIGWDCSYNVITSGHLICTAMYTRYEYTVPENCDQIITFSSSAVYVDCSNKICGAVYKIAPSVNVITFEDKSKPSLISLLLNKRQSIEILNRNSPITIILHNYFAIANGTGNGIKGENAPIINLYCIGASGIQGGISSEIKPILDYSSAGIITNTLNISGESSAYLSITGGFGNSGVDGVSYTSSTAASNCAGANGGSGTDGYAGGYGVVCANINISNVNVSILGGYGGSGGNGGNGQNAGDITSIPNHGVVGTTGKPGGNGGRGGDGGIGKAAVLLLQGTFTVEASASVRLHGGYGGAGGKGGHGGNGGRGGKGGPGKFGVPAAKGGTGGQGGNGGNGGNGGIGGDAILSLSGTLNFAPGTTTQLSGSGKDGGNGGYGGSGGAGGEGGNKWPTNNLADSGSAGKSGNNGSAGESGN